MCVCKATACLWCCPPATYHDTSVELLCSWHSSLDACRFMPTMGPWLPLSSINLLRSQLSGACSKVVLLKLCSTCVVSSFVHTGLVVPVVQERRVWPQPSSLTMTLAWEGEQEGHWEALGIGSSCRSGSSASVS